MGFVIVKLEYSKRKGYLFTCTRRMVVKIDTPNQGVPLFLARDLKLSSQNRNSENRQNLHRMRKRREPCHPFFLVPPSHSETHHLMTGTARLGDHALELVDLGLGTAEGTELRCELVLYRGVNAVSGFDVLSSWRAYGHACPWSCGATQ